MSQQNVVYDAQGNEIEQWMLDDAAYHMRMQQRVESGEDSEEVNQYRDEMRDWDERDAERRQKLYE